MIKIELNYEPGTGNISDPKNGMFLFNYTGLGHLEVVDKAKPISVSELTGLKAAGYTAAEIVELRNAGVI